MARPKWAVTAPGHGMLSEHKNIRLARKSAEYYASTFSEFGTTRKAHWVTINRIVYLFGGGTRLEKYEEIMRAGKRYHVNRHWSKR